VSNEGPECCKLHSERSLYTFLHSMQRPTANELLQHRFIRGARKTSYLTELIERYQDYRARSPQKGGQQVFQPTVRAWETNGTMRSDWNFDTIKSVSAMGTFRSMAKDLAMPPGMELDEGDEESDYDEGHASVDTGGATKGSDPIRIGSGIGMHSQAAHSTVIIRPPPSPGSEKDIPTLLADSASAETSSDSPQTPPQEGFALGAPPAYTGSIRTTRRASYAARNAINGLGTVMREADLGTGVDTIRPVKKVDTAGSLRLSAGYVGSMRREASGSSPTSPTTTHRRAASEAAKAGRSLIDEVVLPILQKVRHTLLSCMHTTYRTPGDPR
jgi:serine/threonine-protein kinase 24/25/MST4